MRRGISGNVGFDLDNTPADPAGSGFPHKSLSDKKPRESNGIYGELRPAKAAYAQAKVFCNSTRRRALHWRSSERKSGGAGGNRTQGIIQSIELTGLSFARIVLNLAQFNRSRTKIVQMYCLQVRSRVPSLAQYHKSRTQPVPARNSRTRDEKRQTFPLSQIDIGT